MIYAFSGVPVAGDLSCLGYGCHGGYGGLSVAPLTADTAPTYAKLAAITILPAVVGGIVGAKWKAHNILGMLLGVALLPMVTIVAVNKLYPTGVRGLVGQ